ncbi:MAG: polyamine aminopropyltransferase [Elusimicrobia bacterium]|nr:polyamine aminopropyltransferase [Elusimicrobiota bacterium]
MSKLWFHDYPDPKLTVNHALKKIIHAGRTKFQSIEILDLELFGLCLVLDGKPQSTEADEFIYHEALVHPALTAHPNPKKVLIAGGGEGATLREALRLNTVEQAVMVDLDGDVVRLCREHLPQWQQGAFDNPKAKVIIGDALVYLKESREEFDLIVSDLTDPMEEGPSLMLFTKEFFELAKKRLSPDGLFVVQSGFTTILNCKPFPAIVSTLKSVFPVVAPYQTYVPSFGGNWGFTIGSNKYDPLALSPAEIDKRLAARLTSPLRFYDGITHHGLFALPKFLRQATGQEKRVITEKEPVFID